MEFGALDFSELKSLIPAKLTRSLTWKEIPGYRSVATLYLYEFSNVFHLPTFPVDKLVDKYDAHYLTA